jgi:hypothetical protein
MANPNCLKCKHYFVTWNQYTPHGCRRYGIQSRQLPSLVVVSAGSGECQGFEEKKRPEEKKTGLDLSRDDLW